MKQMENEQLLSGSFNASVYVTGFTKSYILTYRMYGVHPVQGPGDHVYDCKPHQAHDHHPGISYGTALLG